MKGIEPVKRVSERAPKVLPPMKNALGSRSNTRGLSLDLSLIATRSSWTGIQHWPAHPMSHPPAKLPSMDTTRNPALPASSDTAREAEPVSHLAHMAEMARLADARRADADRRYFYARSSRAQRRRMAGE